MSSSTPTSSRSGHAPRAGRRRTTAALVAALLVVPLTFAPGAAEAFPMSCSLDGAGTEASPYLVTDAEDLAKVGYLGCQLSAHYRQTDDIVLAPPADGQSSNHIPIGPSDSAPFSGVYDGQGRTIAGLTFVGVSGTPYAGLFGLVRGGRIVNVHVSGHVSGVSNVGGLAGAVEEDGTTRGTVVDSSADVEVTGSGASIGGLVGYLWRSDVEGSSASGDVTGVDRVGGLIGYAEDGTAVERSSASGDVLATGTEAGGLVGWSEATIIESAATGDVGGTGSSFGGLVGYQEARSIVRSFATGSVTGTIYVGGLVGYSYEALLEDVYAHGAVTATDTSDLWTGGLVGELDGGDVVRAYSIGAVTSDGGSSIRIHGLIGFIPRDADVEASFWDVDTSGSVTGTEIDSSATGATVTATGLPSADMKLLATYDAAGWDIVAGVEDPDEDDSPVWGIIESRNGGYPFLQALPPALDPSENGGEEEGVVDDDASDGGSGDGGSTTTGSGGDSGSTTTGSGGDDGSTTTGSGGDGGSTTTGSGGDGGSATTSSWVAVDGAQPVEAPGAGTWVRADGAQVLLTVSSPGPGQLRYSADGLQVTFTGGSGTSLTGGLVVERDGAIDCEVCATLEAGGVIESWMFSTPRLVAARAVDGEPCQTFTVALTTPLDGGGPVSVGPHTLQLTLPTASGMEAVNVGVTVGGPVPSEVPSGEGPVPAPLVLLVALLSVGGAVLLGRRPHATA